METEGAFSDSYTTVERMIHQKELGLSELEHLLDDLLKQKNITAAEQETLLALAWEMNTDHPSSVRR